MWKNGLTILQLVVLSCGHLRNTKTDRADAVSASFNSSLQIIGDNTIINSTEAGDHDVDGTKVEVNRTQKEDSNFIVNFTQNSSRVCVSGKHTANESVYSFILINLDRRPDRLQAMEDTLPPALCRKTCRLPAADGRNMSRPNYVSEGDWTAAQAREQSHQRTWGTILTPGAIAMIESSRRVWEHIVSLNKPAVVMEDDVVVSDEQQVLDALCALEEQPPWEMAKLQYKLGKKDVKRSPTFHIRPPNISSLYYPTKETGMYAMTPAAAQKLSKRLTEPIRPRQLDSRHGILREMLNASQVLHAVPAVAFQGHEWGTDIQINRRGESPCKIDVCK